MRGVVGALRAWEWFFLVAAVVAVVALAALFLLWRIRLEVRGRRTVRAPMSADDWKTPIPSAAPVVSAPRPEAKPAPPAEPEARAVEARAVEAGVEGRRAEEVRSVDVLKVEPTEQAQAIELLLGLLDDEEAETRRGAVAALARVPGPESTHLLAIALGRDPSPQVRREAASALHGSLRRLPAGSGTLAT